MTISEYTGATNTISTLADDPNDSGGLTASQLKAKFDLDVTNMKTFINDTLVAELNSTSSGTSGADNVGYNGSVPTVDTVREAIDKIYEGGSGSIPADDTITTAKIVDSNITTAKIANAAITQAKLATGALPCLFGYNPRANSTTLTSSGTWTCPAGVTKIDVWLVGGGGGGSFGIFNRGAGGGGGYCLMQKDITVVPATEYSYTIGAGGTGQDGTPTAATDGGATSITVGGTTYTANGGLKGGTERGGNGGSGGGGGSGYGGTGGMYGQSGQGQGTNSEVCEGGSGAGLLTTVNPYTATLYGGGGDGNTGTSGSANTGNGGAGHASNAGEGGSGVIIIYY